MTDQDSESRRREQEERPPLDERLHKAYVLLLGGAFHVTRLIQLAEELSEKKNESAIEVARSALVFAGACMDATIKQLIQDNLFPVSLFDSKVQQSLSKRIGRILKKDIADDAQELANLLIWGESAFSPFVERVVDDIVSHSFQSIDQLYQVHTMFNIEYKPSELVSSALKARNQIVHEMDALLPYQLKFDDSGKLIGGSRRDRTKENLHAWADELLETAHHLIRQIDMRYETAMNLKSR